MTKPLVTSQVIDSAGAVSAFVCETMTHVYHTSKGPDVGQMLDSIESVEAFAGDPGRGRYHFDEISSDPLPSGHTSRRWGVGIKRPDGSVALKPDLWPMAT